MAGDGTGAILVGMPQNRRYPSGDDSVCELART